MMGKVRRPAQPELAADEVVVLSKPRKKEGSRGELASVHAIAEERQPTTKTGQHRRARSFWLRA